MWQSLVAQQFHMSSKHVTVQEQKPRPNAIIDLFLSDQNFKYTAKWLIKYHKGPKVAANLWVQSTRKEKNESIENDSRVIQNEDESSFKKHPNINGWLWDKKISMRNLHVDNISNIPQEIHDEKESYEFCKDRAVTVKGPRKCQNNKDAH